MNDREHAAQWARTLLARDDVLLLDSETTGLRSRDEIVQLAIISISGQVLLDTLVKPTISIARDASAIHGITDDRVAESPTFADLVPQIRELLAGRTILIYNASFDLRLLEQSAQAHQLTYEVPIFAADYQDVMEMYSQWVGDWNPNFGNYRWQKLPGGDHSALGDCRACLNVLKKMAANE